MATGILYLMMLLLEVWYCTVSDDIILSQRDTGKYKESKDFS